MLRLLVGSLVAVNAQQHNVVAAVALKVLGEVPPVAGRHHLQENVLIDSNAAKACAAADVAAA